MFLRYKTVLWGVKQLTTISIDFGCNYWLILDVVSIKFEVLTFEIGLDLKCVLLLLIGVGIQMNDLRFVSKLIKMHEQVLPLTMRGNAYV